MGEIYDLIIVGLGPAGVKAASEALENGLKVLAFEKNQIGGTCLNKGCIPTKAILHSAEIFNEIKNCEKNGIKLSGNLEIDYKKIIENKNLIVQKLSKAACSELVKKGLEIIYEEAEINFETLCVNGRYGKNIICATGSKPYELPFLPFDGKDVLSSDDILNLEYLPNSIVIIGSGAIGIEWARILSDFNTDVTIVEKAENLLPLMDIDIQKRITRIFKQKRIKIYTGCGAKSFKQGVLTLDDGTTINTEKVLVATGRQKLLDERLKVNSDFTTNYKNVYATGDLACGKMLAHGASYQAHIVIGKILGKNIASYEDEKIPSVVYGTPEIASVGINEQDAPQNCKIYNLPISYLPKSWCDNKIDGFIKIISQNGVIKGAHIVSPEASSLIGQIQILMNKEVSIDEIKDMVFAHPTYSEGILEAVLNG